MLRILLALLIAFPVYASERSAAQVLAFKRANPCPSTGLRRGACVGFVVDHVYPLCAGGADTPENMAWQEVKASRRKDVWERKLCRDMKRKQKAAVPIAGRRVPAI